MKSNQTLKVLFWHRKSKADSRGLTPIICRISIDGEDAEFSTTLKAHVEHCGGYPKSGHFFLSKVVSSFRSKVTTWLILRGFKRYKECFEVMSNEI
jgi:uncharacterized membrane protein